MERIAGADVPMPYAANLERMAVPQVCYISFIFTKFRHYESEPNAFDLTLKQTKHIITQVEDIVRAAKRTCYRSVPMAATA